MEQFKRAKVVMLPTEFTNPPYIPIIDLTGDNELSQNNNFGLSKSKFYHLYIISDDEIKEGDWILRKNYDERYKGDIFHDLPFNQIVQSGHNSLQTPLAKKIIATTDTSLKLCINPKNSKFGISQINSLPQPSQQFIEEYIEEYNKGCPIIDILVEYEYY